MADDRNQRSPAPKVFDDSCFEGGTIHWNHLALDLDRPHAEQLEWDQDLLWVTWPNHAGLDVDWHVDEEGIGGGEFHVTLVYATDWNPPYAQERPRTLAALREVVERFAARAAAMPSLRRHLYHEGDRSRIIVSENDLILDPHRPLSEQVDALHGDLLLASINDCDDWKLKLKIGWEPACDPEGSFVLTLHPGYEADYESLRPPIAERRVREIDDLDTAIDELVEIARSRPSN